MRRHHRLHHPQVRFRRPGEQFGLPGIFCRPGHNGQRPDPCGSAPKARQLPGDRWDKQRGTLEAPVLRQLTDADRNGFFYRHLRKYTLPDIHPAEQISCALRWRSIRRHSCPRRLADGRDFRFGVHLRIGHRSELDREKNILAYREAGRTFQ